MTNRLHSCTSDGALSRRVAVLALLAACLDSDRLELPPAEQAAVDAALAAWVASGLPVPPSHCSELYSVRATTAEQFERLCWLPPDRASSCLNRDAIVYAPQLTDKQLPAHAVHEALHAFVACAYLAPDRFDYAHSDPRVWAQSGGAESVQARAMEALR